MQSNFSFGPSTLPPSYLNKKGSSSQKPNSVNLDKTNKIEPELPRRQSFIKLTANQNGSSKRKMNILTRKQPIETKGQRNKEMKWNICSCLNYFKEEIVVDFAISKPKRRTKNESTQEYVQRADTPVNELLMLDDFIENLHSRKTEEQSGTTE